MIKSLVQMPHTDRLLVIEAAWELVIARGLIKHGVFTRWSKRLGHASALPESSKPLAAVDTEMENKAAHIGRIVRKVARNLPIKANCLPQASAAQTILKRHGIREGKVFLGGRKGRNQDPLDLHAWLYVGTVCVTGNEGEGSISSFKPMIHYGLPPL